MNRKECENMNYKVNENVYFCRCLNIEHGLLEIELGTITNITKDTITVLQTKQQYHWSFDIEEAQYKTDRDFSFLKRKLENYIEQKCLFCVAKLHEINNEDV
jgi:hypothetical protein